jgi:hypothetical protein
VQRGHFRVPDERSEIRDPAKIAQTLLSQKVAGQPLENQIIEEIQVSAHGG